MRGVGLGSLLIWMALGAVADADVVHPGVQDAPPVEAGPPILTQQADGRRAVRGCAVDDDCSRPGEALRELEVELFPPPGSNPWLDERASPASRLEAQDGRKVTRPSELRPDAPWLDQLELPDLPVRWTQRLVDYLVFYKTDPRGRSIISSWLVSQGRYRDLIATQLRKAKLPQDLMYVSMIESSYNPNTLSSAGALGLWQFMPGAGRVYGLRQDRWVDERRDPLRATIAVIDYFKDLYQRFGDWQIALASFNVGYGAMLRSIARYNTNDYYALCDYENAVPWETCLYTPKVLATAIVGKNRALFGFDKLPIAAAETWDEISVPVSVSLSVIARAAGTTEDTIKKLNPHLRRGRTPPGEAGYHVRIPAGGKREAQRRLAELQSDWDGHDAYVVAHGERFEDVATTFGISRSALRRLNAIEHESEVAGGTVLVVPRISAEQRAKNQAKAKVKLLGSGVDHQEGEQLIVPVRDREAVVAGKRRVFYRVVTGDTLGGIAKAFGTKRDQLAAWNGLDVSANLHPRMVLVAWVAPGFDADEARIALLDESGLIVVTRGSDEHLDIAEERTGRVRVEYVAQGKEKLADVAKRYGMGSHDLARINRISYNTVLDKGDAIIVYQVTDPKRSDRAESQWKKTPRARRGKRTSAAEPDKAAPKKVAPKTVEPDKAVPKKVAPKTVAPKTVAPTKAASKEPASKEPASKEPASKEPASKAKADAASPSTPPADAPSGPVTTPGQLD